MTPERVKEIAHDIVEKWRKDIGQVVKYERIEADIVEALNTATADAYAQAAEVANGYSIDEQYSPHWQNGAVMAAHDIRDMIRGLSPDPDYSARIRNEALESACSALLNDIEESESRLRQGGLTLDQRNDLLDRQSHATAFIAIIRARKRKEGDAANA